MRKRTSNGRYCFLAASRRRCRTYTAVPVFVFPSVRDHNDDVSRNQTKSADDTYNVAYSARETSRYHVIPSYATKKPEFSPETRFHTAEEYPPPLRATLVLLLLLLYTRHGAVLFAFSLSLSRTVLCTRTTECQRPAPRTFGNVSSTAVRAQSNLVQLSNWRLEKVNRFSPSFSPRFPKRQRPRRRRRASRIRPRADDLRVTRV